MNRPRGKSRWKIILPCALAVIGFIVVVVALRNNGGAGLPFSGLRTPPDKLEDFVEKLKSDEFFKNMRVVFGHEPGAPFSTKDRVPMAIIGLPDRKDVPQLDAGHAIIVDYGDETSAKRAADSMNKLGKDEEAFAKKPAGTFARAYRSGKFTIMCYKPVAEKIRKVFDLESPQ